MAESTGGLPSSFGEKVSFGIPILLVGVIVSVAISFLILWLVKGDLEEQIKKTNAALATETSDRTKNDGEHVERFTKDEKKADEIDTRVVTLNKEKEEIAANLKETSGNLKKAQEALTGIGKKLDETIEEQRNKDTKQDANISDNTTRIKYIEDKIKKLDDIEKDVTFLKNNAVLKEEFAVLKGDLEKVRSKGEVTAQELDVLTERARIFQLRVLAARAKEAAEAARQGDVKTLLSRLSEK